MTPACAKCRSCRVPQLSSALATSTRALAPRRSGPVRGAVPSARRRSANLSLSTAGAAAQKKREEAAAAAKAAEERAAAKEAAEAAAAEAEAEAPAEE